MKSNSPKSDPTHVCIKKVVIKSGLGLHARPAALFVQISAKFQCDISVKKGRQKVNGKSIMGLMMLAAGPGTRLTLEATGADAEGAIAALEQLILNNFWE
jgi:phosphocarrier protein HPr